MNYWAEMRYFGEIVKIRFMKTRKGSQTLGNFGKLSIVLEIIVISFGIEFY
jgi:hypothetical protein